MAVMVRTLVQLESFYPVMQGCLDIDQVMLEVPEIRFDRHDCSNGIARRLLGSLKFRLGIKILEDFNCEFILHERVGLSRVCRMLGRALDLI